MCLQIIHHHNHILSGESKMRKIIKFPDYLFFYSDKGKLKQDKEIVKITYGEMPP